MNRKDFIKLVMIIPFISKVIEKPEETTRTESVVTMDELHEHKPNMAGQEMTIYIDGKGVITFPYNKINSDDMEYITRQ